VEIKDINLVKGDISKLKKDKFNLDEEEEKEEDLFELH